MSTAWKRFRGSCHITHAPLSSSVPDLLSVSARYSAGGESPGYGYVAAYCACAVWCAHCGGSGLFQTHADKEHKKGWLFKLARRSGVNWKRRFMVLDLSARTLEYYDKEPSIDGEKNFKSKGIFHFQEGCSGACSCSAPVVDTFRCSRQSGGAVFGRFLSVFTPHQTATARCCF